MPRYPGIAVRVRSRNPLVLVSSVRQALRRAGLPRDQVRSFSSEALENTEGRSSLEVCEAWVRLLSESE